jgi:hypothetical protein
MLVLRLFLHARLPLPSTEPLAWLAAGLVEDIATAGFVAALLLELGRWARGERWARLLLGAFAIFLLGAEVVWSKVLTFFGQPPSRDELLAGMNLTFVRASTRARALGGTMVFLLFFALLLWVWARRVRNAHRAWSSAPRLLSVAVLAGLAAVLTPISIHRREMTHNPAVALASIWREPSEDEAESKFSFRPPRFDPAAIRELAPSRPPRKYLDADFPLAHRAPARSAFAPKLPAGLRPNIVFLLLESIRAEEFGAYRGNPPGVTPNLDRLAREGILVEQTYSAGLQTTDAELALWYGVVPNPYTSIISEEPHAALTGLPEILRASGWRSFLWIHNGDQNFYHRDRFFRPRGFQLIDGRDFPVTDPRTGWGYSDRSLAGRAVSALNRASEPFAAEVLTVSNHHPFQVPRDAGSHFALLPGPESGVFSFLNPQSTDRLFRMMQTVHYTDEAVGDFFRMAASRPWFYRTIFVIGGDHGLSILPYQRSIETLPALTELRHRIPLILYSPLLAPARVPGPASQADVLETILGLAGIQLPRAGIGRDLLDPDQFDPGHPVILWSAPGRIVTLVDRSRMYQASVPDEPSATAPVPLSEEDLIDSAADGGNRNLLQVQPETAEKYRQIVQNFAEIYPWLLFSGRSGVSQSTVKPSRR